MRLHILDPDADQLLSDPEERQGTLRTQRADMAGGDLPAQGDLLGCEGGWGVVNGEW